MTRPDDRGGLAVDEETEGIAIAGEDGIDRGVFIDELDLVGWSGWW